MIKRIQYKLSSRPAKWVLFLVFAGMISLFACSKANTFIRILGTWDRVNVIDFNSPLAEEWVFDIDDVLSISQHYKNNPDSIIYYTEGRYEVKVKFTKRYISIYGFTGGDDYMNDEWEIVKSNKNVLIIVSDKQGGLIIREFTKKKK